VEGEGDEGRGWYWLQQTPNAMRRIACFPLACAALGVDGHVQRAAVSRSCRVEWVVVIMIIFSNNIIISSSRSSTRRSGCDSIAIIAIMSNLDAVDPVGHLREFGVSRVACRKAVVSAVFWKALR
jgi:hypothetical protein